MRTMCSQNDRLWTIDDVAEYLRVKASVVKYWIHNERLPCMKIGKHLRFDPEDVREWVEGQKTSVPLNPGDLSRIT